MEKRVDSIVFRRLTSAEFDHIYHSGSYYPNGGGQGYIDFPTSKIPISKWFKFFGVNSGVGAQNRPYWDIQINSLGLVQPIQITLRNRRKQSVSITSQKISGRGANRVPSWHPQHNFPSIYSPVIVIYIVKTQDNQFWAGWFEQQGIPETWSTDESLGKLFTETSADYLKIRKRTFIETTNNVWPFYFNAKSINNDIPTEDDIEIELESEDTSPRLQTLIENNNQVEFVHRIMRIRQRNNKLVRNLMSISE